MSNVVAALVLSAAIAGPVASAAQEPLAGAVRATWAPGPENGQPDRGVGIAFFASGPGAGELDADTILARARPDPTAAVTGGFLYTETEPGRAWSYAVAAPVRLRPNVVEFAYEEAGIPIDSLTPDTAWGRVILGFDEGGAAFLGWVRLDSVHVKYRLWTRELPGRSLFFLPDGPRRLADAPGGQRVVGEVASAEISDYILHPLETQGPWMRVRLARPSDTCRGPEAPPPDTLIGWIRYLDARGRPTVWYYSRGC